MEVRSLTGRDSGSRQGSSPTHTDSAEFLNELHRSNHFDNVLLLCSADSDTNPYVRVIAAGRSVLFAMYQSMDEELGLSVGEFISALRGSIAYPRTTATTVSIEVFTTKLDSRLATMTGPQAFNVLLALAAFWQGKRVPMKACEEARTKARAVHGDQVVETATLLHFAFDALTNAHISDAK